VADLLYGVDTASIVREVLGLVAIIGGAGLVGLFCMARGGR
jgi:hypothetical protein